MPKQLDTELAAQIRSLLEQGMDLDDAALRIISQVMGEANAEELSTRLTDPGDAEAWSMRDLVLFPDQPLALAVEGWLLERERREGKGLLPDTDALVALLDQAGLCLRLPDRNELWLTLDRDEARLLTGRLHLAKRLPESLRDLLTVSTNRELATTLSLACKQARLPWTLNQSAFILTLLRACLPGPGQEADAEAGRSGRPPKAPPRALDMVRWTLTFLEHSGEDIPTALSRRRETLLLHLDQAEEMERVRQAHNFETRRMLGIPEQHFAPEAIRNELELIELTSRATGGYAPIPQIMRRNLGDVQTVTQAPGLLE
ncbi:hypothetical protein [Desulfonatronum thioautotrophicum]|uniref:hypothetical protein n=1 Tax=Desulfonatronum thioautotrophicum TaxID=617001 RepID=UPI0005EBC689|nr:hypothetical protein [Desulfonatronum thioautotrophicum]